MLLVQGLPVAALLDGRHEDVLGREERSSTSRCRRTTAGWTTRPSATESQRRRIASAERNASASARRRFAESSSVRSNHCVACVQFPLSEIGEEPARERVHPLALHRVALVRHRGRADLLLPERLLDLLEVLEEPDVVRELGRRRREARERREDERVLLARVRLARDQEAVREAGLLGDEPVEALGLVRVAVEEGDEGGLRAGRALAAEEAQLVGAADELAVVEREVLQPEARALADRRGLGGLEMREAEARKVAIGAGEPGEATHDANRAASRGDAAPRAGGGGPRCRRRRRMSRRGGERRGRRARRRRARGDAP